MIDLVPKGKRDVLSVGQIRKSWWKVSQNRPFLLTWNIFFKPKSVDSLFGSQFSVNSSDSFFLFPLSMFIPPTSATFSDINQFLFQSHGLLFLYFFFFTKDFVLISPYNFFPIKKSKIIKNQANYLIFVLFQKIVLFIINTTLDRLLHN